MDWWIEVNCNESKLTEMKQPWKRVFPCYLTKWMRYEMNCRRQDKWMKAWSMRAVMKPWIRSFHSTQWMLMKRMGARRHEFTAINEINASEEQAAQRTSVIHSNSLHSFIHCVNVNERKAAGLNWTRSERSIAAFFAHSMNLISFH